jgi:hypothetical protein
MQNNLPRALINWLGEMMESGAIKSIVESTFGNFVKDRRPDLHPFVVTNFSTVWDYVTELLRRRR